jgi:single-stranded DNA-binding protein
VIYRNRVILAGRLEHDPEIRYTPRGEPVIFLSLSLPSERLAGASFPVEDVSIRVMLVGEGSELWAQQEGKAGGNVLVEGGLVQRRWETAEGNVRREIAVIAHGVKDLR